MEEGAFFIINGVVFVKIKKTEEIQSEIDKSKEEEIKAQKENKYYQSTITKKKKIKYDY